MALAAKRNKVLIRFQRELFEKNPKINFWTSISWSFKKLKKPLFGVCDEVIISSHFKYETKVIYHPKVPLVKISADLIQICICGAVGLNLNLVFDLHLNKMRIKSKLPLWVFNWFYFRLASLGGRTCVTRYSIKSFCGQTSFGH